MPAPLDTQKGAGYGPFRLPEDDPDQAGSDEHDDEFERKARGLPTARSRAANDELLEETWNENYQKNIFRPGQDAFARVWEWGRTNLFMGLIRVAEIFLWKSGRVTVCQLDERCQGCICLRDKDKFGNTPE